MHLADWLAERPFTLTMSSGFFGFFAHAGMLLALEERGIVPARITGSSAGALVGSARASGWSARETIEVLLSIRREDFWDPGIGLGLLRGGHFRNHLRRALPVARFEDCASPLALSVHEWTTRQTRVIDAGELVPAIYASCALPLLFQPIRLDGNRCSDGGIADRWGLAGTADGERVFYHHIGSRSPWRRSDDPALAIPSRGNLVALELRGLPRSGPWKLERGTQIVEQALETTRRALGAPVGSEEEGFRTAGEPRP